MGKVQGESNVDCHTQNRIIGQARVCALTQCRQMAPLGLPLDSAYKPMRDEGATRISLVSAHMPLWGTTVSQNGWDEGEEETEVRDAERSTLPLAIHLSTSPHVLSQLQ